VQSAKIAGLAEKYACENLGGGVLGVPAPDKSGQAIAGFENFCLKRLPACNRSMQNPL
jgi:hypothetical protein